MYKQLLKSTFTTNHKQNTVTSDGKISTVQKDIEVEKQRKKLLKKEAFTAQ